MLPRCSDVRCLLNRGFIDTVKLIALIGKVTMWASLSSKDNMITEMFKVALEIEEPKK